MIFHNNSTKNNFARETSFVSAKHNFHWDLWERTRSSAVPTIGGFSRYVIAAMLVDGKQRMLLKRGTGSGERGTGNGSLGTSCQRKPPQKSKMAVQKKGIRALVEIRWGRNCKSDSHFTFTFWAGGMFFRYSTRFMYNMIRTLTLLLDYSVYFRTSLNPACLSPWMFFFPLRQTLGE